MRAFLRVIGSLRPTLRCFAVGGLYNVIRMAQQHVISMSFAMKFCLCFGLFRSFHLCLSTTLGSVHGWTCVRICVKETAGGLIIINYYFFSWKISTPKSTTFSIKLLTVHRQSSPYTNNKFHFHFHEANERKKQHDKADESAAKWTRKKLIFYLDVFFSSFISMRVCRVDEKKSKKKTEKSGDVGIYEEKHYH